MERVIWFEQSRKCISGKVQEVEREERGTQNNGQVQTIVKVEISTKSKYSRKGFYQRM